MQPVVRLTQINLLYSIFDRMKKPLINSAYGHKVIRNIVCTIAIFSFFSLNQSQAQHIETSSGSAIQQNFNDESTLITQDEGQLILNVTPDSVLVKIWSTDGQLLQDVVTTSSLLELTLNPGTYKIEFSKLGYKTQLKEISLANQETLELSISLIKSKKGFFKRNKYWIVAGAAVIATSAILLLDNNDDSLPGIPIPPGRPGN